MAQKTEEQWTAVCDGLFLNDTKPKEWTQTFPWKPSIGFHFRILDESGQPIEETHKKYLKDMWLFQAMGGQNAKGHYFKLQVEHGEVPAKEGKPAQPYTSVMPIAEVFSDGTARFIEKPKDGKVNVPAKTDPKPGVPVTEKPPAPAKPAVVNPQTSTKTEGVVVKDANTAKAMGFFKGIEEKQSDEWWTLKTHLGFDGADATNVIDFAKQMTIMEIANHNGPAREDIRKDAEECLDYWMEALRARLLTEKYSNVRKRLTHYLTLCSSVKELDKVIYTAWVELPESDFLKVRGAALERVKEIKAQTDEKGNFTGKIMGTLQPEVERLTAYSPEELGAEAEEEVVEEPGNEEYIAPPRSGPDAAEIEFTVKAMEKIVDWKKMLAFWNTTKASLQACEECRDAFRVWIMALFDRSTQQVEVDGLREAIPAGIMTPGLEKGLHARYAELQPF